MTRRLPPFAFLAVVALASAVLFFRLGEPDWTPARPQPGLPLRYVWDECLYAFQAHRFLEGDPNAWKIDATFEELRAFDASDLGPHSRLTGNHPPLSTLATTASIWALGWSAFAARLPGAIFGIVIVACTWLLARRVRGERVATLAAALVALDGVWFTVSRISMPHSYVAAAGAAAFVAALAAWEDDARRTRFTILTGALCGLGIAFKETAVVPTALLGALLLVRIWTRTAPGTRAKPVAAWALAFVVLPCVIYLASWLPFFVSWGKSPADFVEIHRQMFVWHAVQPASMGPSTPWWTWPVIWKPVRLFEEALPDGTVHRILARGNPLLWWAAIAGVAWAIVRFARRRAVGDFLIVAGYLSTWLAYALVPRFGFSYYMLPAAPLAALAVAAAADDACGSREEARSVTFWTFGACAAGVFAASYPVLAALPVAR